MNLSTSTCRSSLTVFTPRARGAVRTLDGHVGDDPKRPGCDGIRARARAELYQQQDHSRRTRCTSSQRCTRRRPTIAATGNTVLEDFFSAWIMCCPLRGQSIFMAACVEEFLHEGVVGDTIVGINPLSSFLCVEPQITISLHGRTSTSTAGGHLSASYHLLE